jgi:hypothetical protein
MALRTDFEQDLPLFLATHAMMVNGAMGQAAAGGGTVGQLLAAGGYQSTQKAGGGNARSGVSLTAPLVSATLVLTRAAENDQLLDFSRPEVTATLGAHAGAGDLPVYLIPYEGGNARGVKLPAHGSDTFPVAYAMTATQNGCTVEISGDHASPYASHTNVIDVTVGDAAQKWIAREQKINLRLFKLQQRFAAAETTAGGDFLAPQRNRTQFGFYDVTATGGGAAVRHKNYNATMTSVANDADGRFGKTLTREGGFLGHYRHYCVPTEQTVQDCRNRQLPPQALVVGRRDASGWKFYYQVWRPMSFYVRRVHKLAGLKVGGDYLMNDDGTKKQKFHATVVLASGQLWPNMTERPCTFGLGI